MTKSDLEEILIKMGVPEEAAKDCAEEDLQDKVVAYLAAYNFVYPLNEKLRFLSGEFADKIKKGEIDIPEVTALLEAGATPELIATFAYHYTKAAYHNVLYPLDDPSSILDYIDLSYSGEQSPAWTLVEESTEGELTGRFLGEVHNLIPYFVGWENT